MNKIIPKYCVAVSIAENKMNNGKVILIKYFSNFIYSNQYRTNLVVKTEDIVVCFNLLELEKLQQRLEEALHGEVTASSTLLFLLIHCQGL